MASVVKNLYHCVAGERYENIEYAKSYFEKPLQYVLELLKEQLDCSIPPIINQSFMHFKGCVSILSIPKTVENIKKLFDSTWDGVRSVSENIKTICKSLESVDKIASYAQTLWTGLKASSLIERGFGKISLIVIKMVEPLVLFTTGAYDFVATKKDEDNRVLAFIKVAATAAFVALSILAVLNEFGVVIPFYLGLKLSLGGAGALLSLVASIWKDFFNHQSNPSTKLKGP